MKCSGLGAFFSSLKKQMITLLAALTITSAECLGTCASFWRQGSKLVTLHLTGGFPLTKSVPTVKRRCLQDPSSAEAIRHKFQEVTPTYVFARFDAQPLIYESTSEMASFSLMWIQDPELPLVELCHVRSLKLRWSNVPRSPASTHSGGFCLTSHYLKNKIDRTFWSNNPFLFWIIAVLMSINSSFILSHIRRIWIFHFGFLFFTLMDSEFTLLDIAPAAIVGI